MAKIKRPASNAAYIVLRSVMKGEFLDALEAQPNTLEDWPGARLVVFGSTLMRQLNLEDGVSFPFSGRKSSDIDIGVYVPDPRKDFSSRYVEKICPLLKRSCAEGGFSVIIPEAGKAETRYANGDIARIPDKKLADDFIISKHFTYDEAKEKITQAFPEHADVYLASLDALMGDRKSADIELIISSTPVPTPTLLEPVKFNIHNGNPAHVPLKRDDKLNMLAAKIVRNLIKERFKPTDLIDIYNLLHAKADKPLFNFDASSPDNQLDDLRCLIVANLAIFNCKEPWNNSDLLANFETSLENLKRFEALTENNVSKYGEFTEESIKTIVEECRAFIGRVMAPREEKGHGPLNLTEKDVNFITGVSGYQVLPGLNGTRMTEPRIRPELLQGQYPSIFARHPELAGNLKHNHYLNDRAELVAERRQQIGD